MGGLERGFLGRDDALSEFLRSVTPEMKWIVFSGSGLSADSGVSMFTSKGGLYERAAKQYNIPHGQSLFSFAFFKRHPLDAQAFFSKIFEEVSRCQPGLSHQFLQALQSSSRVVRHYTMNIDGLSRQLGDGDVVEIHGNIRWLFCPLCNWTMPMTHSIAQRMKKRQAELCKKCGKGKMRSRIVLYQDEDSEKITSEQTLHDQIKADLATATGILWIGMSFTQAASIEYFATVTSISAHAKKDSKQLQHTLVNPDEETEFNLRSGLSMETANILHLRTTSSIFLQALVDQMDLPKEKD